VGTQHVAHILLLLLVIDIGYLHDVERATNISIFIRCIIFCLYCCLINCFIQARPRKRKVDDEAEMVDDDDVQDDDEVDLTEVTHM